MIAATPATCGVAIDVPEMMLYEPALGVPGEPTSTRPRDENASLKAGVQVGDDRWDAAMIVQPT